jgi:hypothetical protein
MQAIKELEELKQAEMNNLESLLKQQQRLESKIFKSTEAIYKYDELIEHIEGLD